MLPPEDHNPGHILCDQDNWLKTMKNPGMRAALGKVVLTFQELVDEVGYDKALISAGVECYIRYLELGLPEPEAAFLTSQEMSYISELANRAKI